MKYKIPNENLASILSCLSDNVNSFTRLPSIMEFLKDNTFPKELQSFVNCILDDCKRNIGNLLINGYFEQKR